MSWRFHKGRDPPDFTLALAADPNPTSFDLESLYYGRVEIDGFWYHGQVREDGKCYYVMYLSSMDTDVVLPSSQFEFIESKLND
ncbi:Hypothetical predicted protein [Cloeon dipterum]|uniref:Uncharacterized protein n=1 Tax=Cloeon dipterum TaxID=197152 RepID=A0A8S1DYV1_9INSE|nr:Hypothetical predicted protein [Cloeon dipterum]